MIKSYLYVKCPKCNSKNIVNEITEYLEKVGCLCGFAHPSLAPFRCDSCGHQWDNYKSIEIEPMFKCDNPNCPLKVRK